MWYIQNGEKNLTKKTLIKKKKECTVYYKLNGTYLSINFFVRFSTWVVRSETLRDILQQH